MAMKNFHMKRFDTLSFFIHIKIVLFHLYFLLLSFIFFYFLLFFFFYLKMSVAISEKLPGEGQIRRSILAEEEIVDTPAQGVHTLYDVLQYCVKRRGDKNAFGYRNVEKIVSEEKEVVKVVDGVETKQKKIWNYFQLSPYHYITYKEASDMAHQLGSGLVHLGLSTHSKIEIFAPTK